jgi:two-component system chemotaxis response regulator CheY
MRILVVDDSRAMRMIVVRTLRQAGFGGHDVVQAEDGRQAFGLAGGGGFDLILADWNMPVMNGIELLGALRGAGSGTPFCFVTSEGSDAMRRQADAAGAIGLIAKPFTAEAFVDVLTPVLAR